MNTSDEVKAITVQTVDNVVRERICICFKSVTHLGINGTLRMSRRHVIETCPVHFTLLFTKGIEMNVGSIKTISQVINIGVRSSYLTQLEVQGQVSLWSCGFLEGK